MSDAVIEQEFPEGVRLVVLDLPEDEGEGLGFRLTKTLWDPYPWVRDVAGAGRADAAGLKAGDCLLQADGQDLLGMQVGQVAGLIRGDGSGRGVSLLVWSCGLDPKDDPELLWSCGGGVRGERSRRALAGVLKALACCVCAATAVTPLSCARSHLYCDACWSRLERCALCREALPKKDSSYARNLVAEQVFEAIAAEYDLKKTIRRPTTSSSAVTSPSLSPNISPNMSAAAQRRGKYQLSMMPKKRTVQFDVNQNLCQNYASDPNLHRTSDLNRQNFLNRLTISNASTSMNNTGSIQKKVDKHIQTEFQIQKNKQDKEETDETKTKEDQCTEKENLKSCSSCQNLLIENKLLTSLKHWCSFSDLRSAAIQNCHLSRSLNNVCNAGGADRCSSPGDSHQHAGSLENVRSPCSSPVLLLPAPPIYVISCDHMNK